MCITKACFRTVLAFLVLIQSSSYNAQAMDEDVRAVLVSGFYGVGAGTVLGLASYPFTGNVRGIFIGSSIGLYLGMIMGGYYVSNRYDPENPLRPMDNRPLEDPYPYPESYHEGFEIQIPVYALRF